MAVISVTPLADSNTSTRTLSKRMYSALYRVVTNDVEDGPAIVLSASDLPQPGDIGYSFGNDVDNSVDVLRVGPPRRAHKDSRKQWDVPVTWETPGNPESQESSQSQDDKGTRTTDPLLWRDQIEVTHMQVMTPNVQAEYVSGYAGDSEERVKAGKKGKKGPIRNSAGDAFTPTPQREVAHQIIRVTKNMSSYPGQLIENYLNRVNRKDVTIDKPTYRFKQKIPEHHGRLVAIDAAFTLVNNTFFWRVTSQMHINPEGWRHAEHDKGFTEFLKAGSVHPTSPESVAVDAAWVIRDERGMPIASPVSLDGEGRKLAEGADPVISIWKQYLEADMGKVVTKLF